MIVLSCIHLSLCFHEACDGSRLGNMTQFRVTRRTALRTIAGGVVVGSLAGPAGATEAPATLSHQFNSVRAATRKYKAVETARADGYVPITPYVPAMGFHFAQLAGSPPAPDPFGTDLEDPGVLVYFTNGSYTPDPGEEHDPTRDDDLILGAVEFLVPGNPDPVPDIFADEASNRTLTVSEEDGWHYHDDEGFTALHVWVHRGNPAGVFHGTNPTVD